MSLLTVVLVAAVVFLDFARQINYSRGRESKASALVCGLIGLVIFEPKPMLVFDQNLTREGGGFG
jgi:hypothetical protein